MAEQESEHESRQPQPRLNGPRQRGLTLTTQTIVLGWCLWLTGSWGAALMLGSPVPAARWLILMALAGLMLVWPAIRLSGKGERRRVDVGTSAWTIIGEWLWLVIVLQAAVWPLRLVAHWRLDQTVWLAAALAAWSLLTAALVAMGVRRPTGEARTLTMLLCAALVLGEPAVMAAAAAFGGEPWTMRISPLATVWAMVQPVTNMSLDPWPGHVLVAAAAAVATWVVVIVTEIIGGKETRR